MICVPCKANGATVDAHRLVPRNGRNIPMCVACWVLTERGGDPWPAKQQAEGGVEIRPPRRTIRNPQLKEETTKMPKENPCDWDALFADARGGGMSISALKRKYGPAYETIAKRLAAAGLTPAKGVGGPPKPAAPAAPAKRGRPRKAATAIMHVPGRAATEVRRGGREGAVPGATPQVKVELRTATLKFEGASEALKDQIAEFARLFGVPRDSA